MAASLCDLPVRSYPSTSGSRFGSVGRARWAVGDAPLFPVRKEIPLVARRAFPLGLLVGGVGLVEAIAKRAIRDTQNLCRLLAVARRVLQGTRDQDTPCLLDVI